jgi:hypothetical protein
MVSRDRFGVPWWSLLETPAQRRTREATAEAFTREAFATLQWYLGDARARSLFLAIATPSRGRPKRTKNQDRDAGLLKLYDVRAATATPGERERLPTLIGDELQKRGDSGEQSATATAKHLQRLLAKGAASFDRMERSYEKLRELRGQPTASLLGSAKSGSRGEDT